MIKFFIFLLFILIGYGCAKKDSSSSSNSSSYKIKGVVLSSNTSSRSNFLTSDVKPDKIIAMYNFGLSQKEFSIESDGSFEVDTNLFNKDDLVFFVVTK